MPSLISDRDSEQRITLFAELLGAKEPLRPVTWAFRCGLGRELSLLKCKATSAGDSNCDVQGGSRGKIPRSWNQCQRRSS